MAITKAVGGLGATLPTSTPGIGDMLVIFTPVSTRLCALIARQGMKGQEPIPLDTMAECFPSAAG